MLFIPIKPTSIFTLLILHPRENSQRCDPKNLYTDVTHCFSDPCIVCDWSGINFCAQLTTNQRRNTCLWRAMSSVWNLSCSMRVATSIPGSLLCLPLLNDKVGKEREPGIKATSFERVGWGVVMNWAYPIERRMYIQALLFSVSSGAHSRAGEASQGALPQACIRCTVFDPCAHRSEETGNHRCVT